MLDVKELADVCNQIAEDQGWWAGAPMPIDSHELVMAPSYGYQGLNGLTWKKPEETVDFESLGLPKIEAVNSWWCPSRGGYVHIVRVDGKTRHYIDWDYSSRYAKTLTRAFASFEVAQHLSADAEIMAMDKLRSMVRPHLFNGYVIHGMILETSPRSGVTYVIRKGRPTLALRPSPDGQMKILCCLCLHPVAYYAGTFVGAMVPTDEVISHLVLIRADEHLFWRKANHHPAYAWESGL